MAAVQRRITLDDIEKTIYPREVTVILPHMWGNLYLELHGYSDDVRMLVGLDRTTAELLYDSLGSVLAHMLEEGEEDGEADEAEEGTAWGEANRQLHDDEKQFLKDRGINAPYD